MTQNDHLEIARAIGVNYVQLPALVFFSAIGRGSLVIVTLRNQENGGELAKDELVREFGRTFDHVRDVLARSRFGQEGALAREGACGERRACNERLQHRLRHRRIRRTVKQMSLERWQTLLDLIQKLADLF